MTKNQLMQVIANHTEFLHQQQAIMDAVEAYLSLNVALQQSKQIKQNNMWEEIIKIIGSYKKDSKHKGDRLYSIFLQMSDLFFVLPDKLNSDIFPNYTICTLQSLSNDIYEEMKGNMPEDKLDELYGLLLNASKLENEYENRNNDETLKACLVNSYKFKALSNLYS